MDSEVVSYLNNRDYDKAVVSFSKLELKVSQFYAHS
jgi:hypothetical protein